MYGRSCCIEPAPADLASGGVSFDHAPTEREVADIVATSDHVVRNLRITQAYHDLTIAMTGLLGHENVSWPAFACWASRTAGRFIRGEYIPAIVQAYLDKLELFHRGIHAAHRLVTGVHRAAPITRSLLVDCVERVTGEVAENAAWGNQLVFEDMAPLYARMVARFRGATTYDWHAIERFVSALRPGPVEEGGQDLLIAAFRNYYRAMFEPSRKTRAELILLANNQVGLHEQTRLQAPIVNSLNAPIAELVIRAARERAHELAHRRLHGSLDRLIEHVLRPMGSFMQREWQSVATRWLMRLELPEVTLSLGKDLPHCCERGMFPGVLAEIELTELRALLYQLDRTPNTTSGSAAENWGVLRDRMNFVVDFFRTRQQDRTLYRPPFTAAQTALIHRGVVPEGDL